MIRSWRSTFRLPDNLPILVQYRAERMSDERRSTAENKVGLKKAGWLDTHPSTADRVRRARQLGEPGHEISDAPAREMFENFENLSRLVTLAHYEDDLKVPTTADFLVNVGAWLQDRMAKPTTATAEAGAGEEAGSATPTAQAKPVVPMMAYDPSKFKGKRPPA